MLRMARVILVANAFCGSVQLLAQERYLIGYVSNQQIEGYYRNIVERAYRKIGITPEFIEVGAVRGLKLLDSGVVDADIVRYKLVAERYDNIIAVEPQPKPAEQANQSH
jgi:hypothetical protein